MHYHNNFNFLRFLAASLVVFSHSYPLIGRAHKEPLHAFSQAMGFGALAVGMFFLMSGFLIAKSWQRNNNLGLFIQNRLLRISPGLLVCVFLTTFILGALLTTNSLTDYFFNVKTFEYFYENILFKPNYFLPGVFQDNVLKGVNGSLWTLQIEVFCYAALAMLGVLKLISKWYVAAMIVVISNLQYLKIIALKSANSFLNIYLNNANLFVFFFLGVLFYLFKDKITFTNKRFFVSLVVLIIALNRHFYYFPIVSLIIAYATFCFAFSFSSMNRFFQKHDFSYGIYIYSFPIQQTLTSFFPGIFSSFEFFIISYAITICFAAFSFFAVEKPFLNLKNRKNHSQPIMPLLKIKQK